MRKCHPLLANKKLEHSTNRLNSKSQPQKLYAYGENFCISTAKLKINEKITSSSVFIHCSSVNKKSRHPILYKC